MIIKSLYISDFSGARDRAIPLEPGFNLISGPNESGKTTVAAFIRFMFYGFADKAERTRYFSWGSESASGTMTVGLDGHEYRVERECTSSGRDRWQIVDMENGSPCFDGKTPAEVFLGVPSEVFAHTAFIGQAAGGSVDGEKVSRAIENILFSGDESTSTSRAEKKLDDARIILYHKSHKGGRIFELTEQREQLAMRLSAAKQANVDLIEREGGVRETRALLEENRQKLAGATFEIDRVNAIIRLRGLRRLKSLDEKAKAEKEKYEALCEADSCEGFLPDAEYAAKLDAAEREALQTAEALAAVIRERDSFMTGADDMENTRAFNDKLSTMGGAEALSERIERLHLRKERFRKAAIAAFVIAALLAAVAAAAFFVKLPAPLNELAGDPLYPIIGGLGALIAAIFGVTAIVARSRAGMEINEVLCDLDLDNEIQLDRKLSTLNFDETRLSVYDSRSLEFGRRVGDAKTAANEARERLDELLKQWGRLDDPDGAAADAAASVEKRTSVKGELDKFELARATLAEQLCVIDLDEEIAELESRSVEDDLTQEREERLRYEYKFYTTQNEMLTEKLRGLEKDLAVLEAKTEPAGELSEKIGRLTAEIDALTVKHQALVMAHDELEEASGDLRLSVSPRLAAEAGSLMNSLTAGRYDRLGVGGSLELAFDVREQSHSIDFMSAGTKDVAYLSLRFALIDLLYDGKTPPLIFDESFSRLDDGRYRSVLRLIAEMSARGVQTLLFTSQSRDQSIAADVIPECHSVKLERE